MFPLRTKTFPTDAAELERLLNKSLRAVFVAKSDPAVVSDKSYPSLQEIKIDLNGAAVRPDARKLRGVDGKSSPGLTAERLSLRGEGVLIGPVAVTVSLEAGDVHLNRGFNAEGEIVLGLERASNGKVEISIAKSDLEMAMTEFAKREAGKHSVTIDGVNLTLRQLGAREIEAEASVRARKLFFGATVNLSARLAVDDGLNAAVSGLKCNGEGAIGSLACGFLAPHLEKINGRAFPLMAFSLGEVKLRDVQLSAGERLSVKAQFSS